MELVRLPGNGQLVNRVAFPHGGQFLAASSSAAGVVVYNGRRSDRHVITDHPTDSEPRGWDLRQTRLRNDPPSRPNLRLL